MKFIKLTGLYGMAAIALLLSVTSCKKSSSSSSPKVGTLTFEMNGKAQTLTAISDTTYTGQDGIFVTATGALAGSKDTLLFSLNLNDYTASYIEQYTGLFSDTSAAQNQVTQCAFYDLTLGVAWVDEPTLHSDFFITNVTSNNGEVATGNFSGTLWYLTGSSYGSGAAAVDSVVVTNGRFSVQLQP